MGERLKKLIQKYRDLLVYLVFGAMTTAVNYGVYLPCHNRLHLTSAASNAIAWVAAVIFAYLTNKPFVFHSYDWSAGTVIPELGKFLGTRWASGALETGMLYVAVDRLAGNGNLWKIITSILVILLNYIGSKLLVFRKK